MINLLRTLAFAVIMFLVMPALALEVQGDGLNSKIFIDSHFEFTEVNTEFTEGSPSHFDLVFIENTFTAVTLAQIRSMDSDNDSETQIDLTFNSVAKLSPGRKFEVGWQSLKTYN